MTLDEDDYVASDNYHTMMKKYVKRRKKQVDTSLLKKAKTELSDYLDGMTTQEINDDAFDIYDKVARLSEKYATNQLNQLIPANSGIIKKQVLKFKNTNFFYLLGAVLGNFFNIYLNKETMNKAWVRHQISEGYTAHLFDYLRNDKGFTSIVSNGPLI